VILATYWAAQCLMAASMRRGEPVETS
jgi:hypothetical protein